MSAPKPHTHEWKRMIFMALAGGVTFKKVLVVPLGYSRAKRTMWEAWHNGEIVCNYETKYEAAQFAVSTLMGNSPPLFYAANVHRAVTVSRFELRSSK